MNPNLFIWTSDWHLGKRVAAEMRAAADYIKSLEPAGVIDTGDCKDLHDSTDARWQLDDYITNVLNVIPWATPTGANALYPVLPGNHDELNDDNMAGSDFSPFDGKVWGPPYHWAVDWQAPKIRFIAVHARIVHPQEGPSLPYAGFFVIESAEIQWLSDQLDALPKDWQAIVCSHPPLAPALGSNIGTWTWTPQSYGGTETQALLQSHKPRIVAYISGHRHANMVTADLDGILHIIGPGVSYSQGNGWGGFIPIDYNPTARTLTWRYQVAHEPWAPFAGYTPIVSHLPPLDVEPVPTTLEKAMAELKLTTAGWRKSNGQSNYPSGTAPQTTHWGKAMKFLETI